MFGKSKKSMVTVTASAPSAAYFVITAPAGTEAADYLETLNEQRLAGKKIELEINPGQFSRDKAEIVVMSSKANPGKPYLIAECIIGGRVEAAKEAKESITIDFGRPGVKFEFYNRVVRELKDRESESKDPIK